MEKLMYESPIGEIVILTDMNYVKGLWFSDQKFEGAQYKLDEIVEKNSKMGKLVAKWLDDYFNQKHPSLSQLLLAPEVTEFRNKVLGVLIDTPYGETRSYKELYEQINLKSEKRIGSIRAVGGAVGHNPISIIIPCHRIVGSDGKLTGYAGGIDRKKYLLKLEGVDVDLEKDRIN
ncbi:methylated-DNA--[protein]-cysteine S-methyltransferase [Weissella ceti]|uniref:Methylated-DNA--[protein]-cysteine S-methyltransferase n=1 Tax=Weissella ceti TaxID=759620 RepID=A0ABT3E517_9LACO|nr:methylated-DNA--[protein]-cysteine S-methyltransferase [Weissella ceti]MCW0953509.1 methylated-DNA--[protein]-cysteine S-methyltransferase [Weissella ceti]QVK12096.1 methylated-DNA--[protein]-cysteine S-methyltransferase [Weissella ceti]